MPSALPDPDEILGRMMDDEDSDWADRILDGKIIDLPLVDEMDVDKTERMLRSGLGQLTGRETEVLRGMSYGLERKMCGDMFGIKEQTVKTTLENIRYKLKAKNTLHAVAIALRRGLIE